MPQKTPLVFGIGLPHSGDRELAAAFSKSGHVWMHHEGGALAQSVAYAHATQTTPLLDWPNANGFSGLFYSHKRHLPPISVQDYLTFLYISFPDAFFIHTTRDPADWITARDLADDGQHRIAEGWHSGLTDAELLDHWLEEQERHADTCTALFKGDPRFLDFNVTTQPVEIISKFLPHLLLSATGLLPDLAIDADDIHRVVTRAASPSTPPEKLQPDMSFAQQVIDFSSQTKGPKGGPRALNKFAVHWANGNVITDQSGSDAPIAYDALRKRFVLAPLHGTYERAQGALSELATHGATPPLWVDMMDARFNGTADTRPVPRNTVAYNRRQNAKNLTLWPLPGYHTLAPTGHPAGFPRDTIPFEKKADRCVWLGNMTGRMSAVLTDRSDLRSVYAIRKDMEGKRPDWDAIIADLDAVPRYNAVKTLRNDPDFHIGLVLRDKWKRLAKTPPFKNMSEPKKGRTWFHQFRYILSLAGNDTGSNFLSAAASNALILKEEDGWELFYTDAFKPWVHYIPLLEGALDVKEKLAWARAHPAQSAEMARAATVLYEKFANPENRAAILRGIAEGLRKP